MVNMRKSDYLLELRNRFDRLLQLTGKKSDDYAQEENTFTNFNLIEYLTHGEISAEAGILTRMSDKTARIANLFIGGEFRNSHNFESIMDNLNDLAVYAMILSIVIEQRRKNGTTGANSTSV